MGTGGLDASIGVDQHRPHHARVVVLVSGVLQRLEPVAMTDYVVVEDDHVVIPARHGRARG